jgi:hypothetical protein
MLPRLGVRHIATSAITPLGIAADMGRPKVVTIERLSPQAYRDNMVN